MDYCECAGGGVLYDCAGVAGDVEVNVTKDGGEVTITKQERLEHYYRIIKQGLCSYSDANEFWAIYYPDDPQPMFGPQADMRRRVPPAAEVAGGWTDKCECGSGSNQRGAGHSRWCQLHSVYKEGVCHD